MTFPERDQRDARLAPALQQGDVVAVIAPAGAVDHNALDSGCSQLRALGYRPVYLGSILERDLYFAGTLQRRLDEFHETWMDPQVRAIFCARGGYGANYLLPHLDIAKLAANPKLFIGYSDVTSLLTWFADNGLAVFHGPMIAKDFAHRDGVDLRSLRSALSGEPLELSGAASAELTLLRQGVAQGRFYGGCLSMLVAALGTPYDIHTEGTILFAEDIGVKPYQVDRMLMQLKLAGKLDGVKGFVFGEFSDCVQPGGQDYTLQEIILRVLDEYDVPILFGMRSGHVSHGNITLPIGVSAELTAEPGNVSLMFSPAAKAATSLTR